MDDTRYQVFVSSTFTDLKEEREKVLQAILQLRAFPAGMELFPAADEEQFEFIKREIDSSDYYILIFAGRYGSVAKSGTSYTEMEYDYAKDKNKPIVAFLVKDIGKLIGEKLESKDELKAKLDAFRTKASSNRLVNYYSNPDELKSQVLSSLPQQFVQKPMRGWVRAGQQSLEHLEELSSLQREVLRLKTENEHLSAAESKPELHLASGTDVVEWDLDFNQFSFENNRPTERQYRFKSTWDDLLKATFALGSSQATDDEVKRRIANLILESCPA